MIHRSMFALTFAAAALAATQAAAQVPAPIAAPGESVIATFHAQGAQVYECKAADRRQARVVVPRADRDASARRQDRRPPLRRAELGPCRRAAGVTAKVLASAPGKSANGYPLAQARGHGTQRRQRHPFRRPPPFSASIPWAALVTGACEKGRQLPQCALRRRLRDPAQGRADAPARVSHALIALMTRRLIRRVPQRLRRAQRRPWSRPVRRPAPCRACRRRPCRRAPRTLLRTRSTAENRAVRSGVTPTTMLALPSSLVATRATTPEPSCFLPSSARLFRSLMSMPATARAISFTSPTMRTPSAPSRLGAAAHGELLLRLRQLAFEPAAFIHRLEQAVPAALQPVL